VAFVVYEQDRTNHIWWHPNDHHLEELMLSLTTLVSSHSDKSRPDSTDVSFHQSTLWMSVLQTCSCMVAYILYLSGLLVDQKSNRIKFDISLSLYAAVWQFYLHNIQTILLHFNKSH